MNLYDFPFRSYSPHLGRWLQRDPLGYVDGVNLYEYARSRPTFFLDPLGLAAIDGSSAFADDAAGVIGVGGIDDPADDEGYPGVERKDPGRVKRLIERLPRTLLGSRLRERGFDDEAIEEITDFWLELFWRFFGENLESWERAFQKFLAWWNQQQGMEPPPGGTGRWVVWDGPHKYIVVWDPIKGEWKRIDFQGKESWLCGEGKVSVGDAKGPIGESGNPWVSFPIQSTWSDDIGLLLAARYMDETRQAPDYIMLLSNCIHFTNTLQYYPQGPPPATFPTSCPALPAYIDAPGGSAAYPVQAP